MIGTDQHIGPEPLEVVIHRFAGTVDQAGKTAIADGNRRQFDMTDAFTRKTRDRRSARHQNYVETIRLKGIGDAAGAGYMADAKKMLDIKENTGPLFHLGHGVFSHSVSKSVFSSAMLVR
ncbi:hypothetical protein AGR2A_Cc10043 [Agrobacterium genomosp. 2 str. CFBP 5494]|uniref:Uncharacterized protein n=1 Tax=Agrobacterium genomosp. 2 str. CFBP 5494 TaxID=1183436 RepID=A0A9W5F1K7_9HYPH|nr:hypothetical protein AGR2A_Cc10043 [Agrobacterium genomosp. 2 str. CFBP 5494]